MDSIENEIQEIMQRLKRKRKEKGISVRSMARQLNMGAVTISKMELGWTGVSMWKIIKIARFLEM